MATRRLAEFERDIMRAKDMVGLGQALGNMTNGLVDATDLYRGALVQAVAAWDRYVHGVILDRAVDIILGRLTPGAAVAYQDCCKSGGVAPGVNSSYATLLVV